VFSSIGEQITPFWPSWSLASLPRLPREDAALSARRSNRWFEGTTAVLTVVFAGMAMSLIATSRLCRWSPL